MDYLNWLFEKFDNYNEATSIGFGLLAIFLAQKGWSKMEGFPQKSLGNSMLGGAILSSAFVTAFISAVHIRRWIKKMTR